MSVRPAGLCASRRPRGSTEQAGPHGAFHGLVSHAIRSESLSQGEGHAGDTMAISSSSPSALRTQMDMQQVPPPPSTPQDHSVASESCLVVHVRPRPPAAFP